ncbi:hypothetical protein HHL23_04575 [Chryseobacterium sp. RP-3-3]|uniref:HTH luxR-type domain-containing protein n=1 Tax=Chryseobacterium antibioticum TaxID=2728847 RepID=A0A7Y0AKZ0_9FLAO|nr:hypothetical protein [Chryseobacterium antibioticum]
MAEYTFTSYRTVETRKSMIRKKLNLSSKEDLYIWMSNLNKK